jgi:hypothetical protein
MGSPIGRYESDLQRYRSDARRRPWLDDDCFELSFCARVAIEQIENMLQRSPASVTEMRQMLNELGSVFARVTHAMTRTTKPGEDYCGPTNPHPRDLRQFVLFDVVRAGLPVLLTEKRNRQAALNAFETHLKPLLYQAKELLAPLSRKPNCQRMNDSTLSGRSNY